MLPPAARLPRKKSQKPTSAAGRTNISFNLSLNAKLRACTKPRMFECA